MHPRHVVIFKQLPDLRQNTVSKQDKPKPRIFQEVFAVIVLLRVWLSTYSHTQFLPPHTTATMRPNAPYCDASHSLSYRCEWLAVCANVFVASSTTANSPRDGLATSLGDHLQGQLKKGPNWRKSLLIFKNANNKWIQMEIHSVSFLRWDYFEFL